MKTSTELHLNLSMQVLYYPGIIQPKKIKSQHSEIYPMSMFTMAVLALIML